MEKVVIVNDIPEDSVEIYLQNEVLDASVTIQEDYQSKIDQNSQAKYKFNSRVPIHLTLHKR